MRPAAGGASHRDETLLGSPSLRTRTGTAPPTRRPPLCWASGKGLAERLDPEPLRGVMSRYFEEMRHVVKRHGGTVAKFIGDAVMAVFGVPLVREDDAFRAVRAAMEMRDALAALNRDLESRWGVKLVLRIGINTGEVATEDSSLGGSLVVGDAVNIAARLQQVAAPDEILLGSDTYALVSHRVRVAAVEPLTLKGKRTAIPGYRLIGLQAAADRRSVSPMVGRDTEFDRSPGGVGTCGRTGQLRAHHDPGPGRGGQVPADGGVPRLGRYAGNDVPGTLLGLRGSGHVLAGGRHRRASRRSCACSAAPLNADTDSASPHATAALAASLSA